ncbi:2880_t:CDS:2, partial [Gigaspora margarita]
IEFQNRGATHLHGVYWTTNDISAMITANTIRSTLLDPNQEPELYQKNAHINAQNITDKGLARYITKYISKPEPTHLFNIHDQLYYREYIHARCMGSMELMFLLLGERIVNSLIQVQYLTTDPPTIRSKAVLPLHIIDPLDDDLFWNDKIKKYFSRPLDPVFDSMTYKTYYELYEIKKTNSITSQRTTYYDQLENTVIKRANRILTQHGKPFFYQQLILRLPCRSEPELYGGFLSYRDHFLT